jgi:hypothetical protein
MRRKTIDKQAWNCKSAIHASRAHSNRFVIEGEQRYWVHPPSPKGFGAAGVAIDRFTGQVIDKQIEVVNE